MTTPPGSSDERGQVIDRAVLDGYLELGGVPFLTAIIDQYCSEANGLVDQLVASAARDDAVRQRELAHALRGSSATVGAASLAGICARMESALRAGASAEARLMVSALAKEFQGVVAALSLERDAVASRAVV